MAKVTKETDKWGKYTADADGVSFIGEELVSLTIPVDRLNPIKHAFCCINGNPMYLAAGKAIQVPQSVATLVTNSINDTIEAEMKGAQITEIK